MTVRWIILCQSIECLGCRPDGLQVSQTVVAYATKQRTHEIGIRMSLGAEPASVLTLVLREGILLAGIGTVLGLAGAWAVRQVLSGLLYGVLPSDPATYIGASILVFGATVAACYMPALRAARVDPMTALRCE